MARCNADGAVVALHGTAQDISTRHVADNVNAQALRIAGLESELVAARARNTELDNALARARLMR